MGEPCFLQGQGGITGWHTLAESVAAAFAAFAAIFCCRIHSFMPIFERRGTEISILRAPIFRCLIERLLACVAAHSGGTGGGGWVRQRR